MLRLNQRISPILLLVIIGAYLLGTTLLYDSTFILQALLLWGTNLAIVIPFVGLFLWIMKRKKAGVSIQNSVRLLGLAFFIFLIYLSLLLAPSYGWLGSLNWNWQGKLVSLAISSLFIIILSELNWKDIGFTRPREGTWLRVFLIIAGVAVFWIFTGSGSQPGEFNIETLLFQAIPGFDEELIFRGILWILIARALPGRQLVITTLLFALLHGVVIDDRLTLTFDSTMFIYSGVVGYLIGRVRLYSKSIVPAILLHNGVNLITVIILWLIA